MGLAVPRKQLLDIDMTNSLLFTKSWNYLWTGV